MLKLYIIYVVIKIKVVIIKGIFVNNVYCILCRDILYVIFVLKDLLIFMNKYIFKLKVLRGWKICIDLLFFIFILF